MNKKILIGCILAIFMLLAISFSTVVSSTPDEKRESPLFRIRTRRAIGERLDELKEIIKAKFIGDRVFFLPFQWLRNKIHDDSMDSVIFPTYCQYPCTYEKGIRTCWDCTWAC